MLESILFVLFGYSKNKLLICCPSYLNRVALIILMTSALAPQLVYGLDCSKSKSRTEQVTCSSLKLKTKYELLLMAYREALKNGNSDAVYKTQRNWINATEDTIQKLDPNSDPKRKAEVENLVLIAYDLRIEELKKADAPEKSVNGTLSFDIKKVDQEIPYSKTLEYPIFKGTNTRSVSRVNDWLRNYFPPESGCEKANGKLDPYAGYKRVIKVKAMTSEAINFEEESIIFCSEKEGQKIRSRNFIFLLERGVEFGLNVGLTPKSEQKLVAKYLEESRGPTTDACKREREQLTRKSDVLEILFSYPNVFVRTRTASDCFVNMPIGMNSFIDSYVEDREITRILKGFGKN